MADIQDNTQGSVTENIKVNEAIAELTQEARDLIDAYNDLNPTEIKEAIRENKELINEVKESLKELESGSEIKNEIKAEVDIKITNLKSEFNNKYAEVDTKLNEVSKDVIDNISNNLDELKNSFTEKENEINEKIENIISGKVEISLDSITALQHNLFPFTFIDKISPLTAKVGDTWYSVNESLVYTYVVNTDNFRLYGITPPPTTDKFGNPITYNEGDRWLKPYNDVENGTKVYIYIYKNGQWVMEEKRNQPVEGGGDSGFFFWQNKLRQRLDNIEADLKNIHTLLSRHNIK